MESKGKKLREMLAEGQVFAPCIWDCMSAKAAELSGFKAILLAGGPLNGLMAGFPDVGLITADDLVRQTEFICEYSPLPLIIDADDGYGETPLTTYRTVKRLAKAGAAAVTIEDSTGIRGYNRWSDATMHNLAAGSVQHPIVSRQLWLSKIKAAVAAVEDTGCMVIARTEAKFTQGLDEAIARANLAREVGCDMCLIMGVVLQEEAEYIGARVPGWKMWPDVQSKNGKPDVELADIASLDFRLVTTHIFERAAFCGALDAGLNVYKTKNTVYADNYPTPEGLNFEEQKFPLPCFAGYDDPWMKKEKDFMDIKME